MNEKNYKKRLEFQQKMISRQSKQIESLKTRIEELQLECKEKDKIINSVAPLRNELKQNVDDVKKYKEQYVGLINELRKMKEIMNQTVYKNRWKIIKWLLK